MSSSTRPVLASKRYQTAWSHMYVPAECASYTGSLGNASTFSRVGRLARTLLSCMPCMPLRAPLEEAEPRDWKTFPALTDLPMPRADLWAVSDPHADPGRFIALLRSNGLLRLDTDGEPHWSGGQAVLVIVGDFINKGHASIALMDLIWALELEARAAGGRVVTLLGNHEAELLANPHNKKADRHLGINREIAAMGMTPKQFIDDENPRGHWLRTRSFGARIGNWFFAHGGNSAGRTFRDLSHHLEHKVDTKGFNNPALVGRDSLLVARDWYKNSASTGAKYSAALGTQHIVFGHNPNGLGPKGSIATGQKNTLLRIDCGMSRDVNFGTGMLLRVRREGSSEVVHACDALGTAELLFRA